MKQLLSETPLSEEQEITEIDTGVYLLRAVVKNTEQLRWWIRSFGSSVEVLEPLEMREKFVNESKALNKIYRN